MKQLFHLLFIALAITGNATVRTVSNIPSTIAQFNTVQAAINASSNGDTVYVNGSPNSYAGFTLTNLQLVIIGPGWSPDKDLGFEAQVNGCTITGTGCNNTEIQGIAFVSTNIIINSNHPDNLSFIRNRFSQLFIFMQESAVTYTGYSFEGNWFDNSAVAAITNSTYQNFIFHNNYFYDNATIVDGNFSGFAFSVSILFDHNLWFGPNGFSRKCFLNNCRFLTLVNNIFVNRDAGINNSSGSFSNNITFNAGNNTPWASNGNTDGGGNVANQDPQMVAQASVNAGVNDPTLDFSIAAGPANNSGSDGKDMGLLYDSPGSLNWTNSHNSRLPRIFSMNVTTPTVPAGGNVTISIVAKTSN